MQALTLAAAPLRRGVTGAAAAAVAAAAAGRGFATSTAAASATAAVWVDKNTKLVVQGFTGKQVRVPLGLLWLWC